MQYSELKTWAQEITSILACPPGTPQLLATSQWLQRLCRVDHFVLFIYQGNYRPLSLFDTFSAQNRLFFVDEYQTGAYLLDPFYLACSNHLHQGLHSLKELAPDHFYFSEYFLSYYHRLGLTEEIAFFVDLGDSSIGVLSLMRGSECSDFNDQERQLLECAEQVVARVVKVAWEQRQQSHPRPALEMDHAIRQAFERFGEGLLTARECEVARLLLRGHSNDSIARQLFISSGTVKIHRKNLYTKLGIGSQSELLALFIDKLAGC
ncbi:helix-turn-helix transcriptional regulator [Pseudomonas sp. Fl5BN2]|uniref:helix-turn-helix domain-containing protein n=1 Tax=Pseudomonas sp. Fl5BN2 TaxID=2697652 RepID=UPI001378D5DB|nr:helix-turn-helix transcriptional regulator [Pseudomonas sp. Fl5BN2]NBF01741.1 helix-turn-helix transcriptional regulator [Pseudomonas sp. Fl5BN2]